MSIRQLATATALTGFLAVAGGLSGQALAMGDVEVSPEFYNVKTGTYILLENQKPASSAPEQAAMSDGSQQVAIPDHVLQGLRNN